MADQAQLYYNAGSTVNLQVLAVHGCSEPDHLSRFGVTHNFLDGSIAEQIAGGRREISIDFQTMGASDRRKCVLWWLDPDRKIVCLVGTPTISGATAETGGSLTASKNYIYKICAIDVIGNGIASASAGDTTDASKKKIVLVWGAVSDARRYKIYRQNVTDGGHWFLLDYAEALTYTDDGTVTPLLDLGVGSPPVATSTISVVTTNDVLEFKWGFGTELNRMLSIDLREATIFKLADEFRV